MDQQSSIQSFQIYTSAELNYKSVVSQINISSISKRENPVSSSYYYEVIISVEISASPGCFLFNIPNLSCDGIFLHRDLFSHFKRNSTYNFNLSRVNETVKTIFFKEGSTTPVEINGDLKFCTTTPQCFPAKKIVGLIGFKFTNLLANDVLLSTDVIFQQS